MRRRVLLGLERTGERCTAYWGIGDPVDSYGIGNDLGFSSEQTMQAAAVKTRLTRYPQTTRMNIVRAGYAHADVALRSSKVPLLNFIPPSFRALPEIK